MPEREKKKLAIELNCIQFFMKNWIGNDTLTLKPGHTIYFFLAKERQQQQQCQKKKESAFETTSKE